jgi:hypothetical protein
VKSKDLLLSLHLLLPLYLPFWPVIPLLSLHLLLPLYLLFLSVIPAGNLLLPLLLFVFPEGAGAFMPLKKASRKRAPLGAGPSPVYTYKAQPNLAQPAIQSLNSLSIRIGHTKGSRSK